MTDEELRKLVPSDYTLCGSSTTEMWAWLELEKREKERMKPIKRQQAVAKHEDFLSRIEREGFQEPTVQHISSLLNKATHVAFSNGVPEMFEVFQGWEQKADPGYFLRIRNSFYDDAVKENFRYREDIGDVGCLYKRQVFGGMILGNLIIIRGKYHEESDLFVDVMSFLRKEFVPAL